MATRKLQSVDGNHILYHYLQKDLFESDIWLFQMLSSKLVASLGIWLHPEYYKELPVLLPYVVRDSSCRKSVNKLKEEWGAPDELGFLRDDNSLIKGLVKSLCVESKSQNLYHGKKLGNGFVASHVWRRLNQSSVGANLASKDPLLNSFVPNLVWLPSQVSKLTDREGTFTQLYLQALSVKLYRHINLPNDLSDYVENIWNMLELPTGIPEHGLPNIEDLSFFSFDKGFVNARKEKIANVAAALNQILKGNDLKEKIITSRYGENLRKVKSSILRSRKEELDSYLSLINYYI